MAKERRGEARRGVEKATCENNFSPFDNREPAAEPSTRPKRTDLICRFCPCPDRSIRFERLSSSKCIP